MKKAGVVLLIVSGIFFFSGASLAEQSHPAASEFKAWYERVFLPYKKRIDPYAKKIKTLVGKWHAGASFKSIGALAKEAQEMEFDIRWALGDMDSVIEDFPPDRYLELYGLHSKYMAYENALVEEMQAVVGFGDDEESLKRLVEITSRNEKKVLEASKDLLREEKKLMISKGAPADMIKEYDASIAKLKE